MAAATFFGFQVQSALAYNQITPSMAGTTITLNGKNLTLDKLVAIARYGAKVQLTQAARQRSLNAYYLLLEGSREGMPIYFFNRGTGAGRQTVLFAGDPLSTAPIPAGQPGAPD
ncbi:MAG TPA: aromatic amino acid lyase, partial [Solirubrobacteraceae bacterium]